MKILFDCDGTILESMHIWVMPLKKLLEKYDYELTTMQKGSLEALDFDTMSKWLSDNVARDMTVEEIKDHFTTIITNAYQNDLVPKKGAVEVLKKLKEKNIEMAITSSTDLKLLEICLSRLGLMDYFKFIQTPSNCPFNKGQKEYWQLAAENIGEDVENIILYDDALYAIKAASSVGIKTCGLKDFPYNQAEWNLIVENADMVLDSIADIDVDNL